MPNPNSKHKGRWIQSFGLLVILTDAVFGFLMFRGDLGEHYLGSVMFPILIAAVVVFTAFMAWGGMLIKCGEAEDESAA